MPKIIASGDHRHSHHSTGNSKPAPSAQDWHLFRRRVNHSPLHRHQKPIASLRQRLDITRILRIVTQCFAHPIDRLVQSALKIDNRAIGPKSLLQSFPRHHLTVGLDHRNQRLKWLFLDLDSLPKPAQFSRCRVNLEVSKANQQLI